MKDVNIEDYKNKFLSKMLSSHRITDIYPMVDRIDAYDVPEVNQIILRIYVNDPEMTKENMYQRDMDPHYLIDYHLSRIAPYFSIPKGQKYGFVILNPQGQPIHSYMD
jgi:hypothetical protein